MTQRDIVIAAYAEARSAVRTQRSAYDIAGEVFSSLLDSSGIGPHEIDGLSVTAATSECANPFYAAFLCDALGLEVSWLNLAALGGCSAISGVARAMSAIRDGQCTCVLVISADAPTTVSRASFGAWRDEFQAPQGVLTPPAAFGLLMNRYAARHGLDPDAPGKIAVTQRAHGLMNPNACEALRKPLTIDDYRGARMIADPLRLLDCVMLCDGGSAVLVTTRKNADRLGLRRQVAPVAYAEISNHAHAQAAPDATDNGFAAIAPRLFAEAGCRPQDIRMLQLYDDFTIAVLMQLEAFGYCPTGEGSRFALDTDLSYAGTLPLNTGGGQLSAGQPGLAGGGVQLTEAVRQLFGDAGARQVRDARRALVTGIGVIPYGRNWTTSAALVLEV